MQKCKKTKVQKGKKAKRQKDKSTKRQKDKKTKMTKGQKENKKDKKTDRVANMCGQWAELFALGFCLSPRAMHMCPASPPE